MGREHRGVRSVSVKWENLDTRGSERVKSLNSIEFDPTGESHLCTRVEETLDSNTNRDSFLGCDNSTFTTLKFTQHEDCSI